MGKRVANAVIGTVTSIPLCMEDENLPIMDAIRILEALIEAAQATSDIINRRQSRRSKPSVRRSKRRGRSDG